MNQDETVETPSTMNISNCTLTGIKWDAQATEALVTVSKSLLNITELFKAQHIEVHCLVDAGGIKAGVMNTKVED